MDIEELKKAFEETQEQVKQLKSSNERLLNQSKEFKEKYQDANNKLSEAEKAKLEAEGKIQERLEIELKEKSELEQKFKKTQAKVMQEKLRAKALSYAKDAYDIDDILRQTQYQDLIKRDYENLEVTGVEEFVSKVRAAKPNLFDNKNLTPTEDRNPKVDDLDKPEGFDKDAYHAELDKCKTQKELDDVMRKYGRLN